MARQRREGEFFLDYENSVWQHHHDGDALVMAAPKKHLDAEDKYQPTSRSKIAKLKRLRLFCQMREEIHSIFELQAKYSDEAMGGLDEPVWAKHQRRLDALYDDFVRQFEALNTVELRTVGAPRADGECNTYKVRPNLRDFREDPDAYLVASIEKYNEDTGDHRKGNIFTKRVIAAAGVAPEFDSTRDALMYCVAEQGFIDLDHVATLMEKTTADVAQELIETGAIFQNPQTGAWELAEKYLSGHIREKLLLAEEAAENEPFYATNVEALTKALPIALKPEDIAINLGMHWIPSDVIEAFASDALEIAHPEVQYVPETHSWFATGGHSRAGEQFGTENATPIHILQASLNNKPVSPQGRDMVDRTAATILAREKQEIINEAFKTWIWQDPARAERIITLYNEQFNSSVLRDYDGAHLNFPGQSLAVSLRPHQNNAVWRNVEHGNTLYGHEVGAGKTWASVAAAMEMRRLGRVDKPCFVVPNHLLDQWGRDFKLLYPHAKLLVLSDEQFRESGKKQPADAKLDKFVRRARTQDCDAIILTQSNFDRLPAAPEGRLEILLQEMNLAHNLQDRYAGGDPDLEKYFNNSYRHKREKLQKFIDGIDPDIEIDAAFEGAEEDDEQPSRRRDEDDDFAGMDSDTADKLDRLMRQPIDSEVWKPYLAKIRAQEARDYYGETTTRKRRPYFDDTKVDYLFVDEGQDYKNLGVSTRLEGMGTQPSKKAASLYAKVYQLRKQNPDYFLSIMTGTPISNAISEMYNVQRYMQEPMLRAMGIHNFDAWVAMFADYVSSIEMSPEGSSYRVVSRLARYKNVPELLRMFLDFTDIVTGDMLNLPKPELKDGKHTVIRVPRGKVLEDYIEDLSDRATAIRNGQVTPKEDNMLRVTNDGRFAALHPALVGLTPEEGFKGKIDYLADEVAGRYQRYKDNVYTDVDGNADPIKGALQMVFCDIGTTQRRGKFSAYAEIKRQLVARGVPEKQIRFIHECKNDRQKDELFEACRAGKVSVLIGTTQKLGTGTNVQKRLIAQHHLDAPWRPGDIDQRDGRIMRQGNQNKEVEILRYVVEGSFDTYMWQTLERKAKFIAQIMRGDMSIRHFEDNDTNALSYAEVKALASGDPLILEKAGIDNDFARVNRLRTAHEQGKLRAERDIAFAEINIRERHDNLKKLAPAVEAIEKTDPAQYPLVLDGQKPRADKRPARMALGRELRKTLRELREDARVQSLGLTKVIGTVYGFTITAQVKHEMRVINQRPPVLFGKIGQKADEDDQNAAPKPAESRTQHIYTLQLSVNDPTGCSFPITNNDLIDPAEAKAAEARRKGGKLSLMPTKKVDVRADDEIPDMIVEQIRRLQHISTYDQKRIDALTTDIEELKASLGRPFEQQDEYDRLFAKKKKIDAALAENADKKKDEKASEPTGTPATSIAAASVAGRDGILGSVRQRE